MPYFMTPYFQYLFLVTKEKYRIMQTAHSDKKSIYTTRSLRKATINFVMSGP